MSDSKQANFSHIPRLHCKLISPVCTIGKFPNMDRMGVSNIIDKDQFFIFQKDAVMTYWEVVWHTWELDARTMIMM